MPMTKDKKAEYTEFYDYIFKSLLCDLKSYKIVFECDKFIFIYLDIYFYTGKNMKINTKMSINAIFISSNYFSIFQNFLWWTRIYFITTKSVKTRT